MSSSLFIRNVHLIDPASGVDLEDCDIWIEGGCIKDFGTALVLPSRENLRVIEGRGLIATAGWIDMHVHLRDPGFTHKETIYTGSLAAAHGGFTSVACMANTEPVNDNSFITTYIYQQAQRLSPIQVYCIGAITKGLKGQQLAEIGLMYEAGIVGISDDGQTVMDAYIMRKAMDYSRRFDLVVISHAEDSCLKGQGVMNEGKNSMRLGLRGNPRAAEEIIVARDIQLAKLTKARLHIAHVSTKGSVELIRRAKEEGVAVTAEVTPHHLHLTDEAVANYDTNAKVAPPLREEEDVIALREALQQGVIDCVASDHAPHTESEKATEFDLAPFGMVGLETAFPLYYDLVLKGLVSLSRLIEAMTICPARILKLEDRGRVERGKRADLTLFDPKKRWRVEKERFYSKSTNTPFQGWELQGEVAYTICGGKVVYSRDPMFEIRREGM